MALFNQTFHYERDQAWTFSYCSIKHQNNWQTTCVFLFDSCSTYNIKGVSLLLGIFCDNIGKLNRILGMVYFIFVIFWSMFTWLHNLPWLQKNKPFFYSRISHLRTVLQWLSINTTTILSSLTVLSFRWKERNCIKEVIVRQSRFL